MKPNALPRYGPKRRVLHLAFCILLIPDHSNKWQIAIQIVQIQPIAIHKFIRNVETDVIEFHFHFAPLVFIEQRANLQAGRRVRSITSLFELGGVFYN